MLLCADTHTLSTTNAVIPSHVIEYVHNQEHSYLHLRSPAAETLPAPLCKIVHLKYSLFSLCLLRSYLFCILYSAQRRLYCTACSFLHTCYLINSTVPSMAIVCLSICPFVLVNSSTERRIGCYVASYRVMSRPQTNNGTYSEGQQTSSLFFYFSPSCCIARQHRESLQHE